MNSQHALMVSVTCTLLYRVPSSVTHDPIVTRLQLATYSDLSSHTPLVVLCGITSHTMSLKLAGSTPNRLRPQAPPHPVRCLSPAWGLGCQGPASACRTAIQAPPQRVEEARALWKQSERRENALFFVGRSLKGAGAPLPAPPLQRRNKTAAIFSFVSNSPLDPGVGSPVREAFVRALMSGSSHAADSPGSWPPSPPGQERAPDAAETKRRLRQWEQCLGSRDACFLGSIPHSLEEGPIGHRAWASGHTQTC